MTPEEQRLAYQVSCTHYRKANVVHEINGSVVFTGKSINEAKRYVAKEGIRSYTKHTVPKPQKVTAVPRYVKKTEE